MRFDERIEVKANTTEVWSFLWDVERVAKCLPGCQEVRVLEPQKKYAVVIMERVGPFKARFDNTVDVLEMDEANLRVKIQAVGNDKKLGASTRTELTVKLEELATGGTSVDVVAEIQVIGKIASLGQVVIRRKAQDVVKKFAQAISQELEP